MRKIERVDGPRPYKVRFRHGGRETSRHFRTHKDANTFRNIMDSADVATALAYFQTRETSDAVPTLDQWAPTAIASRSGLGPGQRADYQQVYDRTWGPRIGRLQLHAITKADVSRALNDLSERGGAKGQGLSDKSCKNALGILSGLFTDAIDAELIAKSPTKGIRSPNRTSHDATEMRFLSHEEFARLYDATPEHWQPLLAFMAGTGCRWGEVSALLARDVDLEHGVVNIRRAVKWNGNNVADRTVGPPKTKRSRRTIVLPVELVPMLAPLVEANKGGELFRSVQGGPAHYSYWYPKVWVPAVRAAKLDPPATPHSLRHTHASWLIQAGVDMITVQRRLGHTSITQTVDRYSHLAPDQDAKAAAFVFGATQFDVREIEA